MDFVVGFVTVLSWNDATQTFTREYILKVHIRSVNLIYIYEKNIVSEVEVMAISEQECVKSHLRKCIYNFIYLRKALHDVFDPGRSNDAMTGHFTIIDGIYRIYKRHPQNLNT